MTPGSPYALLIEELKDILIKAGQVRNTTLDVKSEGRAETESLRWYQSHINGLIGYSIWLVKVLSKVDSLEFSEAYYNDLVEITEGGSLGVPDLIDQHAALKTAIATTLMAYKSTLEKDRQLELLGSEIAKHIALADTNFSHYLKRNKF